MDQQAFERLMAVAIRREVEANQFYRDIAAKAKDPTVRGVFEQLGREELGHQEILERYRSDPTMMMKIGAPVLDTKVAEATELPTLSTSMKPADAIALAMKKEQQAVEFYRDLAASSSDKQVKDVFLNLANMELGHKGRLESVYVDVGYPEAF